MMRDPDQHQQPAMTYAQTTNIYGSAPMIRAEPQSPGALEELAGASHVYAEAAAAYIVARDNLSDARNRWQNARDVVAKASESEGI